MKALIVAEYYPRAADPAQGIWSHRQTLATRAAGAEVMVLVLHRPLPPLRSIRERDLTGALQALRQPGRAELDGVRIDYLRYLSPPRPLSYASWGAWAAPLLGARLRAIRRHFGYDLIHAHYAVPAGDAVRRTQARAPLVVSVHGHDVYGPLAGAATVRSTLRHARLVLANSEGTAQRSADLGGRSVRVVHLGADRPAAPSDAPATPTLVSVGNLVERKRHTDVLAALALLRDRQPGLRYVIVGDGPARAALTAQVEALGLESHVQFRGALPPAEALDVARSASLFVLPSVDEAFGVAYIEAMAGGVPAIGCRGEDGPEEIAAAGPGMTLVTPRDPPGLADAIDGLLGDPGVLGRLGAQARATVECEFTWEACGRQTVAAYEAVLRGG